MTSLPHKHSLENESLMEECEMEEMLDTVIPHPSVSSNTGANYDLPTGQPIGLDSTIPREVDFCAKAGSSNESSVGGSSESCAGGGPDAGQGSYSIPRDTINASTLRRQVSHGSEILNVEDRTRTNLGSSSLSVPNDCLQSSNRLKFSSSNSKWKSPPRPTIVISAPSDSSMMTQVIHPEKTHGRSWCRAAAASLFVFIVVLLLLALLFL